MKTIMVYMHTHRAGAVVESLREAGIERVAFSIVSGMLNALGDEGHSFSVELGSEVLREARLDILCEDIQLVEAIRVIRDNAHTGQRIAGYAVITDVLDSFVIDGRLSSG